MINRMTKKPNTYKHQTQLLSLLFLVTSILGCFPSKKVMLIQPDSIEPGTHIKSPVKAFLFDSSVMLFPNGFSVSNDTVIGYSRRFWIDKKDDTLRQRKIQLDSIAAMTYYELKSSGESILGSGLLGLYGGILTPLSLYCISCPKCCFGSCPTVYGLTEENYDLQAELFSYSISKYFQESDLDRVSKEITNKKQFRIRLSNEALETHYINQFVILKVDHQEGTEVYPTSSGELLSINRLTSPVHVINSMGEIVTQRIENKDNDCYRSDWGIVRNLSNDNTTDWLDITLDVPRDRQNVNMVVRMRNTLLSTILFYDVVLASQGIHAIEWTEKMNTDPLYASKFNSLYKSYAGIKVKIHQNGQWQQVTTIGDVGPLLWKDVGVKIPIQIDDSDIDNKLLIRLEFFPDNFMIDYIGYEENSQSSESLHIKEFLPESIYDDSGTVRNDILSLIQKDDSQFLVTNPGESYYFDYNIDHTNDMETTLFIRSKGYYTEWIRGEWLTTREQDYHFDLREVDKAIARLKQSWLDNRELLENEFFKTRIPLKEER
ncbi:hypothetical protein IIC38_03830 [candidate division KSB1 bacterium]|nr:hypothetical protein [candidate division KSB1 bacterium]